jgi:hypothetical protein
MLKAWSNRKAAISRKISFGGPPLRSDHRRPLNEGELSEKCLADRQLTEPEVKQQCVLVSRLWDPAELQQLKAELDEMNTVDKMSPAQRVDTICKKVTVQLDDVQAEQQRQTQVLNDIQTDIRALVDCGLHKPAAASSGSVGIVSAVTEVPGLI